MDFFTRQQHVRRMSSRLVFLFVVAVIGIVAAVDLAVVFAFNAWEMPPGQLVLLVLLTSLVTGASIGAAAGFRTVGLRGGGSTVARELGGVPVPQDTTDPQLRRLRNVVEEIAIASGVPVPDVYLLPDEAGINAFAAGWSTSDAAVAVTRGALERLNRDELQGVIAHEFSHVVNGDMRLNIRLMGLLFGILFLTIIGRTLLRVGIFSGGGRSRDGDRSGGNPLPIIGIALLIAGFIGVVAGRLIKASVSRQREYLADASAVQFTRQTSGIAGALKKIAGLPVGSKLRNPRTEEVGHMLFGSGLRLSSLFATHPPLPDRIKALEPSFDPAELAQLSQQWAAAPPSGLAEDIALGLATPEGEPLPHAGAAAPVDAGGVVAQIAAPSDQAHRRAGAIIDRIPDELLVRARSADRVVPLVLGLLMSDQPEVRQAQHAALAQRYGRRLADDGLNEAGALAGLHPLLRLPLAELSFPALRQRAQVDREAVLGAVSVLIHADGRTSVFEYCLSRLLYSELYESTHPQSGPSADRQTLTGNPAAAATLLAVLAQAGQADPARAAQAFETGMGRVLPRQRVPYHPPAQGVLELDPLWSTLDRLNPGDKSLLVGAAVDVIAQDGVMTVTEMELLRTICGLLHCPLPPFAWDVDPAAVQASRDE